MSVQSFVAACSAACLLALSPLAQAAPTPAAAPAATTPAPSAAAAPLTPMQAMLATVPPPKLDARAWLVVDLTSGQILAEHDAHAQEAPASLTKLMTAYLTFKALKEGSIKLNQMVTESKEAWQTGGSRMFIDPRVPVSVNDLLLGMIVQSGNDAAMTLAQTVGGSVSAFVAMMNRQAQQWGLKGTHFMDPTGLPDPGHHTTAYDLSIIATHIIRDFPADYARYFKVKEFTYNHITQPNRVSLLFTDPSVDGMKTGYTSEAGYCMITSALRQFPNGPRRLLTVVMGTPTERARGEESQVLLNWAYQNFDDIVLASPGKPVLTAPVWKGVDNKVELGSSVPVVISVPRGMGKDLQTKVVRPDPLVAPLQAGQRVGQLDVSMSGKPLAVYPLEVIKAVPEAGLFGRAWDSLRLMIK
ncbi:MULTISPECIES: D-alanyl-D-alanine carboxypeptidase family protein [unclassified Thiomonas]|jgi:D-alanyl-D-alanine carboxypeptidase (penicillin-binding protein 5/6)|uniref:D-alanyl-D-alanine carboxypeptidase family protein n=1 Tax=unclassified Thiomonas TaxID=2625466 RepID=UPI0004DBC9BD|nr:MULTISPECIES: D-alanyl-D-alanine carboxypeptidase family protein [unclassified Thiomonas]MDD5000814.1 D-alanyl-D-alanine carboxypeptidase [Thiomonas arsenitoxydans]CQR43762.1 D-alanyl-D-alanine carboxypeptidase DacC [Thiomonas sp. CB3]CDW92779.1 D-alanyl-D-alanine carboxypeptidase DacC [Thiomonas sp. CB2]VDY05514.1 D-alanyl-D-alanine carboxypeptidase DacC [Thiomonas sp. Bio17B3]VDY07322.1 D-alanyl-D-alanine carboxypeptidase DacC [Thiomonas sp. Sup16B3]